MREINGERLRKHLKGNSGITEKMHDIAVYLALRVRDVKLLTVASLITSSFFLCARSGFPAYICCEVVSLSSCRRHCKEFMAVSSLCPAPNCHVCLPAKCCCQTALFQVVTLNRPSLVVIQSKPSISGLGL